MIKELVERFKLLPHPEGGYYRENYRSLEVVPQGFLPKRFKGDRNYGTAIYYLLAQGDISAFHRIQADEGWHFYEGGTLLIHIIHLNGRLETIKLGRNFQAGEVYQATVPARCWFASEPAPGTEFAFTGCTVAPGFDFDDFEMADKMQLSKEFPQHKAIIDRLSR